jgi:hypothetical protein
MMTVDSGSNRSNYKIKVSGAGTAKSNLKLQGYLFAPNNGVAELAAVASSALVVQILTTDNKMTVGIGHSHRFFFNFLAFSRKEDSNHSWRHRWSFTGKS